VLTSGDSGASPIVGEGGVVGLARFMIDAPTRVAGLSRKEWVVGVEGVEGEMGIEIELRTGVSEVDVDDGSRTSVSGRRGFQTEDREG